MLVIQHHLAEKGLSELLAARDHFYSCKEGVTEAIRRWPSDNEILFGGHVQTVRDELNEVLPYVNVLAHGLRGNPRQIKRFLNVVALRRRLAKENELEIQQDFLLKLAVLEYAWEDFFNSVVDTVDPTTGCSELIGAIIAATKSEDVPKSDSKLVAESLNKTGLIEYMLAEPVLSGDIDLRPYLYLSQTALSRGRAVALVPVDEKARSLARMIESDDPLRTKTAAKRTASEEPAVVGSVVRILLADFSQTQNIVIQTHILNGLDAICRVHRDQYSAVLMLLGQIEVIGKDAVAISASTLLENASKAGINVSPELKEKFAKGSKIAAALTTSKKKHQ